MRWPVYSKRVSQGGIIEMYKRVGITGFLFLVLTATCLAEWVYVGPNRLGQTLKYEANSKEVFSDRTKVQAHLETDGGYILTTVELLHADLMIRNLDYSINGGSRRQVPKSHRLRQWHPVEANSAMFHLWRAARY